MPEDLSDIIDRIKSSLRDQQVKGAEVRAGVLNPITTFFEKTSLTGLVEANRWKSQSDDEAFILAEYVRETYLSGAFLLDLAKVEFSDCG